MLCFIKVSALYIKYESQCFIGIFKHREESRKCDMQRIVFDEFRGVWIVIERLSLVFYISSYSKQKLRSKVVKIYGI